MSVPRRYLECRSCGARIFFAAAATSGKRMPIDAEPAVGATIRIATHEPAPMPMAYVVGSVIDLFDPDDDGIRYTSHFATCPDADSWRSTR